MAANDGDTPKRTTRPSWLVWVIALAFVLAFILFVLFGGAPSANGG